MKDRSMFWKRLLFVASLTLSVSCWHGRSQNSGDLSDLILLVTEDAERLASSFVSPITEGLLYGITGGWYHSAKVQDKWGFDLSIVSNGTFVPSEKRSFVITTTNFSNLRSITGETVVRLPTILGGSDTLVQLLTTVEDNGEQQDIFIEVPAGGGFLSANLLPSAFLQGSLGLPYGFEIKARYFPRIKIDDVTLGLTGVALQHEFTRWFKGMEDENFALSAFFAYTNLSSEYDFDADGLITGVNDAIDINLDSWLVSLVASTKYEVYNLYGGFGYVAGDSQIRVVGDYTATIVGETFLEVSDPFTVKNKVDGIRANIGGSVRMGRWFFLNLDYTFQGFNNVSLGLNFNIN